MTLADYHLHTADSADSTESMAAVCRRAVELGLHEICFTEHFDTDPYDKGYGYYDDARYQQRLDDVRREFAGRLVIRKGLEFDWQSRYAARTAELLAGYRFDFLIGSVHCVFGSMAREALQRGFPPEEVYREYFAELRALVATGLPDVLGHVDYVRKVGWDLLGDWRYDDFDREMADLMRQCAARGVGLEVNTRHRDRGQPIVPGVDVLRAYRETGGRTVTLGSDAHTADAVGAHLDAAAARLREAGFTEYTVFCDRRPTQHPLP
jgi:histidinol-phosphatase (PHP family)